MPHLGIERLMRKDNDIVHTEFIFWSKIIFRWPIKIKFPESYYRKFCEKIYQGIVTSVKDEWLLGL